MTTSFNRTRTQVAQRVLGKVIKVGAVTQASADYELIYEALDLRLKSIHKQGTFWRKVTTVPVTFSLSASVATASAGAGDILYPIKITWSNGSNDDPVQIVGMRDYAAIEDKTRVGNPEKALWKGGTEFIFYPIPSANGTAKLLYEKIIDDTSAGGTMDIDVAMILPLMDIIKYDVADDYEVPEATQMRWRAEAIQAEKDIRKLSVQRTDTLPVAVDNFDDRPTNSRKATDY